MPCSARAAPVSLGLAFRKLAQARPAKARRGRRDADASEPHLRIPAEYHCRPREQRETGNNGRVGTKDGSYRVEIPGEEEGRRKKKERQRKSSEEERIEEYERGCIASGASLPAGLLRFPPPRCPYFLQSPRRIVALSDPPRSLRLSFSLSRLSPAVPLNSHVTLRTSPYYIPCTQRQHASVYDDIHMRIRILRHPRTQSLILMAGVRKETTVSLWVVLRRAFACAYLCSPPQLFQTPTLNLLSADVEFYATIMIAGHIGYSYIRCSGDAKKFQNVICDTQLV